MGGCMGSRTCLDHLEKSKLLTLPAVYPDYGIPALIRLEWLHKTTKELKHVLDIWWSIWVCRDVTGTGTEGRGRRNNAVVVWTHAGLALDCGVVQRQDSSVGKVTNCRISMDLIFDVVTKSNLIIVLFLAVNCLLSTGLIKNACICVMHYLTLRWLMSYIYIYIWSTHSWCF